MIIESKDSCTAEHKCWEHYQGWHARVTERDISLAIALVRFRAATVVNTAESIASLCHATWLLQQLSNTQWREIVREPFRFESPLKKALANPTNTLTLDDLDL